MMDGGHEDDHAGAEPGTRYGSLQERSDPGT